VLSHPQPTPGVYQFKVDVGTFSASPYGGDTAMEGMEDVSAGSLYELEAALYKACAEKSGIATYNYQCDLVKPGVALFTACIGTAKIGGGGGGGGGGGAAAPAAAAPAAAAKAAAPAAAAKAPEPEEEEEAAGFVRRATSKRRCPRRLFSCRARFLFSSSDCSSLLLAGPLRLRTLAAKPRWGSGPFSCVRETAVARDTDVAVAYSVFFSLIL